VISSISIATLSPGITISTPSGSSPRPSRPSCGSRTAAGSPLKNGVCRPPSSFVSTYTSALNFVCGVIEPGFASTWPRSTSLRLVPRSSPDVVARLALVQQLLEHLHARHDRLLRRRIPTISISRPP
jgi:hypothetical protein